MLKKKKAQSKGRHEKWDREQMGQVGSSKNGRLNPTILIIPLK